MHRFRKLLIVATAIGALALTGCATSASGASSSGTASANTLTIASPQCAHCLAMAMLPGQISGYNVQYQNFSKLSDLEAGLASGRINVGQIDYTGLVSVISQGLPIVAISGEVNGGSDLLVAPSVNLQPDDWAGFKALAAQRKAAGKPFTIASQFGSVQDIELRLQLPKEGIDPSTDVTIVNTPYEGMGQALNNGSADAAAAVQPFAASIVSSNLGKHFAFPYDQAAGDLTNVVVVSQDYLEKNPAAVAAIAAGMVKLTDYLGTDAGKKDWSSVVQKYTNTDAPTVDSALTQLKPDLTIPMSQVRAIADAMYAQGLITTQVTDDQLKSHIDYDPLAAATGTAAADLGQAK